MKTASQLVNPKEYQEGYKEGQSDFNNGKPRMNFIYKNDDSKTRDRIEGYSDGYNEARKQVNFRNTLMPHARFSHISKFSILAKSIEYPFFCWNDRIYHTSTGADTGLTIKDLE